MQHSVFVLESHLLNSSVCSELNRTTYGCMVYYHVNALINDVTHGKSVIVASYGWLFLRISNYNTTE